MGGPPRTLRQRATTPTPIVSLTPTATSQPGPSDGGDSSFLDSILNQSFLLGPGFVVLVLVVFGIGYYLGARNSRSRNNW